MLVSRLFLIIQNLYSFQVREWSEAKYTIEGLEKENDDLMAQLEKLRREIAILRNDQDNATRERTDLQSESKHLLVRVDDLENQLQKAVEEKSRFQKELNDTKNEETFQSFRRESETVVSEVSGGTLEAGVDMFPEMQEDLDVAKRERDQLNSDVLSWQNKFNTLQNSYDNLEADKNRLEDKLDSMQKTISSLEQKSQTLTSDKNKLNAEIDAAKRKINDLLSELDATRREKDSLRQEYELLQKEISKMEAEYEIHISTSDEFDDSAAYAKLQDAYKRSQERQSEMQEELLSCYKVIGELKNQVQRSQETIERLTINYNTETVRSASLRDEVVSYQRRLSELEEKNEVSKGTSKDLENEMEVVQQRISELSRENSSIQESKALIAVEVTNQRKKILRLEQQLDDAEREKESLRLQLSVLSSKRGSESQDISRSSSVQFSDQSFSLLRDKQVESGDSTEEGLQRDDAYKSFTRRSFQSETRRQSEGLSTSTKKEIESLFDSGGSDKDLGPAAEATTLDLDLDSEVDGGGITKTTRITTVKSTKSRKVIF